MRPPLLSYHLQRARLEAARPYIRGDVLDIGCGSATAIEYLADGQNYCGIELDAALVTELRRLYPNHTFLARDVAHQPLDLAPKLFSTVLLIAVVEHLRRPEWVLRQARDLLRPGGTVVITTPTPWGDAWLRWGGRLRLFSRAALDSHERVYDRTAIQELAASTGYAILLCKRFEFGCNWLVVLMPQAMESHRP